MLAETSLLIKQVSAAVGYTASANFIRHFQQTFGISPGEYRRRGQWAQSDLRVRGGKPVHRGIIVWVKEPNTSGGPRARLDLRENLLAAGYRVERLDRESISLDISGGGVLALESVAEHIGRIGAVAELAGGGVIVVVSVVSQHDNEGSLPE